MRLQILLLLIFLSSCEMPDEKDFESCIQKRVEKKGGKLIYFLQTKQRYISNDLLLKKIKVTLLMPDGKKVNAKDSVLFHRKEDGSWECIVEIKPSYSISE